MAGENYIGSKISLISLSDIRYVGILHSINAQDSTVGLKQVRSFGTEGRRGKPEEEIPASDNVFDYVVFRGSDIKDLQVFEAPPPPLPQPAIPQDPAIMSMNGYPPMNPYLSNNNNMYMQPPPPQQKQPPLQQQQQQPPPSSATAGMPAANVPGQKYWKPSYTEEVDKAQLEKDTLDELKAELEETDALQPTINEAAIEQLAKKVSELHTGEDNVISGKEDHNQQQQAQQQQQQQNRRRYDNNNNNYRGGRGGRYGGNNDRQINHNKAKAEFSIPTSEFDFEASNAKFDKSEIVKKDLEEADDEEEEIEIPQPDEFYDKTSSFFDNISCESKERNEQRQMNEPRRSHFHEERKLNLETFGQATVDQSRYRNNYRGGRGGYRGGNRGGYYRNNNNRNNGYNNNNNHGFRQQQHKNQDQQESI